MTHEFRTNIVKLIGLNKAPKLYKLFQITITFFLICFSWIFFRAENMSQGFYIVSNMLKNWHSGLEVLRFDGVLAGIISIIF